MMRSRSRFSAAVAPLVAALVFVCLVVIVPADRAWAGGSREEPGGSAADAGAAVKPDAGAPGGPELASAVGDAPGHYLPFDEELFREAGGRKRVYFFHATWCSNCRAADKALKAERERIPPDVVLFRTNFDTARALKQRYAVTYQHTFVLVDAEGEMVRKWSGGAVDELIANTQ